MYEYQAKVLRVVDGDTLHLAVDLGLDVGIDVTVRLYGVDCPERSDRVAWAAAGDYVRRFVGDGRVILVTIKDGREKYGRYLGLIYKDGLSLNENLIANGHATPYPSSNPP
jgi:micrococcal nuclease